MGRRVLLLAAAGLTMLSLVLPLWGFRMSAPQYPDETLNLRVDRHGIAGDVQEVQTLQQYIGVRFPERLPELAWATRAVLVLSGLIVAGVLAGGRRGGKALRFATAVLFGMFLAASAAVVQKRLYEVGHMRDPGAPIRAVKAFTPPLVGPVKVGNFTVWSFPHLGAAALLAAAGCVVFAVRGGGREELGA